MEDHHEKYITTDYLLLYNLLFPIQRFNPVYANGCAVRRAGGRYFI